VSTRLRRLLAGSRACPATSQTSELFKTPAVWHATETASCEPAAQARQGHRRGLGCDYFRAHKKSVAKGPLGGPVVSPEVVMRNELTLGETTLLLVARRRGFEKGLGDCA